MPPANQKRALFSLNLDSNADHVYQRVDDHNKDGTDRVKVLESKGPTHGHTNLNYLTKPFEKTVNRAVNDVIDGSGKKVHSAQGELTYSSSQSGSKTTTTTTKGKPGGNLNVVSKVKRRNIERKYDTSDL
jgi:hypothetical protein